MSVAQRRRNHGSGKLIETWKFSVGDKTREVNVYIQRGTREDAKYKFYAETVPLDGCSDFKSEPMDDINLLREWASKEVDLTTGFTWEKSIVVHFKGDDGHTDMLGEKVEVEDPEALDEWGKLQVSTNFEFRIVDTAWKNKRLYFRDNKGRINIIEQLRFSKKNTVVPWTQEREDALKTIRRAFVSLNDRLETLLKEDNVIKTLGDISGGALKLLA